MSCKNDFWDLEKVFFMKSSSVYINVELFMSQPHKFQILTENKPTILGFHAYLLKIIILWNIVRLWFQ